jgi:hypothetical protein
MMNVMHDVMVHVMTHAATFRLHGDCLSAIRRGLRI